MQRHAVPWLPDGPHRDYGPIVEIVETFAWRRGDAMMCIEHLGHPDVDPRIDIQMEGRGITSMDELRITDAANSVRLHYPPIDGSDFSNDVAMAWNLGHSFAILHIAQNDLDLEWYITLQREQEAWSIGLECKLPMTSEVDMMMLADAADLSKRLGESGMTVNGPMPLIEIERYGEEHAIATLRHECIETLRR